MDTKGFSSTHGETVMQKVRNAFTALGKYCLAATAGVTASVTGAYAALPAVVGTTLDSVETDALALVDLVWPIVVTLFGAILLIKLFKRAAGKI
jgi:hypothetical protein